MIQTTLFPDTFKDQILFDNEDIADVFEQVADLLEAQGDDYYRIRAYHEGAHTIRQLDRPAVEIYQASGLAGLQKLPHIGQRLALSIEELTTTGELGLLERLLIEVSPEDLFTTVPGMGKTLARRIYRALGVSTLEELEQAAHDGSLAKLEGFGRSRVQMVSAALATMLGRSTQQRAKARRWQQTQPPTQSTAQVTAHPTAQPTVQSFAARADRPDRMSEAAKKTPSDSETSPVSALNESVSERPPVELLLSIDEQYRYLAGIGQLLLVTPRRFNPEGKRWLPVMRTSRDGWRFNVLYSNTARAHDLSKTHDWVVMYYEREATQEANPSGHHSARGQCTIVTETRGLRRGQRVIRGIESAAA